MKAISLWQPWASLMAVGAKTIETRGRLTHIRGDVAIHSAMKIVDEIPLELQRVLLDYELEGIVLPLGEIVAVVEIYECWTTEHLINLSHPLRRVEIKCGDYSPGRFGWATRNLRRLNKPVPCKGRQGFFNLPADVEAKVKAQL